METATAAATFAVRPLARGDLDAVVAIDATIERRVRRAYIERRLAAALREPKAHAQFAATDPRGVAGYILARAQDGEFGRDVRALRLELVGVRDDRRGQGIGERLLDALVGHARRHGVRELRTVAAWNDHGMLGWLDRQGFALAPNHIVDCAVDGGAYLPARDAPLSAAEGEGPANEIDFGAPRANDFERLARDAADVRSMAQADLRDIVRIDRARTGRDREAYIGAKLAEALGDSGVRVSLTARVEGLIAGFLMARTDLGDFGRVEPTAVIDTIAVDPDYEHRGIGHALVSQLFANLGALRIERVETIVAPRDLALLGFLYDVGFVPSQRLPFVRRVD
jgi:ribosomal protein S18 acetylase RimI-like enzyme